MKILIGVTGSIAAIKIKEIVDLFQNRKHQVRIVCTENGRRFVPDSVSDDEMDYWTKERKVLHIELRKWADVYLICPLSANTLAKLSCGLADNLVTNVARCWDFSLPIIVCPAMNTCMWNHPVTQEQLNRLIAFGYQIVKPVSKKLACGDVGIGAMEDPKVIVENVLAHLK